MTLRISKVQTAKQIVIMKVCEKKKGNIKKSYGEQMKGIGK